MPTELLSRLFNKKVAKERNDIICEREIYCPNDVTLCGSDTRTFRASWIILCMYFGEWFWPLGWNKEDQLSISFCFCCIIVQNQLVSTLTSVFLISGCLVLDPNLVVFLHLIGAKKMFKIPLLFLCSYFFGCVKLVWKVFLAIYLITPYSK